MKKKIFVALILAALLACIFAVSISAETPENYIKFKVKLVGQSEYIEAYTKDLFPSDPMLDLKEAFYSDIDFTQEIAKEDIEGMDFSEAVPVNGGKPGVVHFKNNSSPYPNCKEIKWFNTPGSTTIIGMILFQNWKSLEYFDFGCATEIVDRAFMGCGLKTVVLPEGIKTIKSGAFGDNKNLESVVFKGATSSIAGGAFSGCTSLKSVDLGQVTVIGEGMFQNCTSLTTVDLSKATAISSIGKFAFSGCTSLKTIISSGVNQEGAVIIPEGVTHIYQEAFCNCDSIKYLSLPSTITYLGPSIIRDSSALEFVDFNGNPNNINLDNWGHFSGCTSLKAVSLPDAIKTINNRFMTYCTSLMAVYLPADLEQMNTNGNNQGPFCGDTQMYFVAEPFEVRDENGYFLGESFVMPEKPETYYFPKKLSKAGGNVNSGTWFRDCLSLNKVLVMPEAFTDSTVVQMFRETANASNLKYVVYLGDIKTYAWSERNHHISFVFANPNDTDLGSVEFIGFYNNLNSDCYFYFCSTGFRYTMNKASVEEIAGTKVENTYCHVKEKELSTEADCENPKMLADYCFCGAIMGEPVTEGEALGHSNTIFLGLFYESYMEKGYRGYECDRCATLNKDDKIDALFAWKGYSYSTFADVNGTYSVSQCFAVNKQAIAEYTEYTGKAFKFGVLATGNAGGEAIAPALDGEKVLSSVLNNLIHDYFEIKVSGITEKIAGNKIVFCAFVIDDEAMSYLDGGITSKTVTGVSYNELANPQA